MSSEVKYSSLVDIMPILNIFEKLYNDESLLLENRCTMIDSLWAKINTLSIPLKLSSEDKKKLLDIDTWWNQHSKISSPSSSELQSIILDGLLKNALASNDFDTIMEVFSRNKYKYLHHHTDVIIKLIYGEHKQDWILERKKQFHGSQLIEYLENKKWNLSDVSVEFYVESIDKQNKKIQFSVKRIKMVEDEKTPCVMTLEWLLGFEFNSEMIKKKYSSCSDGSGSAEMCTETGKWIKANRMVDNFTYSSIRTECEQYMSDMITRLQKR